MDNSNLDFASLFEDSSEKDPKEKSVDAVLPELADFEGDPSQQIGAVQSAEAAKENPKTPERKRSSKDFEPDMDALLITAQSHMIIEGTKAMTEKNFSGKNMSVYLEAIKGVELYIKILERNPDNYNKLYEIINQDVDCSEVERIAFRLYENTYKEKPFGDRQKLIAYEIFRDRLKNAYYKALINQTMMGIRKYYRLSGSLDEEKITKTIQADSENFKADIDKIGRYVSLALDLMKTKNHELSNGLNGKDMNLFVVKATEFLTYYYNKVGNTQTAGRYQRLNENHRRYFVVR